MDKQRDAEMSLKRDRATSIKAMLDEAPRQASIDIQKDRLNKAGDVRAGSKIHH